MLLVGEAAAFLDGVVAALRWPNLLAVATLLLAACWTAGGAARRASGLLLGLAGVVPAWFLSPAPPLVRGASALAAFAGTMRVIDLRRGEWSLGGRLAHVASFVDTRRLRRAPSRVAWRLLATGAAWLVAAGAGYAVLLVRAPPWTLAFWIFRWGGALLLVYSGISAGYVLFRAGYAALGFETGPLHVAPVFSRSVEELWGDRWARPVSLWLRDTVFRPCIRRRRPVLGGLLAFVVSGAFHGYVVWVALGLRDSVGMAACMVAYFVLQSFVVALERRVRVRRWPAWGAHAWTVAWMLATAPVFLEPAARLVGVAPP